jgi:hypothetical protein
MLGRILTLLGMVLCTAHETAAQKAKCADVAKGDGLVNIEGAPACSTARVNLPCLHVLHYWVHLLVYACQGVY